MLLTAKEVAERLGVTYGRVIQMIHDGIIAATRTKFSKAWQIDEAVLENMNWSPRPRKAK